MDKFNASKKWRNVYMLGIEWENFEKLDKKEYIIKKNPKFLSQYREMKKKNFATILNLDEIQSLIDSITRFYEFKYPSQMLDKASWVSLEEDQELRSCIELSKLLDIKQLQYRLSHDQLRFLECSYGGIITLNRKTNFRDGIMVPSRYVHIDSEGRIDEYDVMFLKESEFLDDTIRFGNVEELYEICQKHDQLIDYHELEKFIGNHKSNIHLRDETLNLVLLSLLYANGELPSKGYARAKSFMRMFNREYDVNLNMKRLDDIMSIDYSDTEGVKRLLKSRK